MNSYEIYNWFNSEINGVKRIELINISKFEEICGIPQRVLRYAIKGERDIRSIDKHVSKISEMIKLL